MKKVVSRNYICGGRSTGRRRRLAEPGNCCDENDGDKTAKTKRQTITILGKEIPCLAALWRQNDQKISRAGLIINQNPLVFNNVCVSPSLNFRNLV